MKNTKSFSFVAILIIIVLYATVFTACTNESKSDKEYWFSSYDTDFVAYDDDADNIAEAGSYWNMTAKKDCTITLSLRVNIDYYSAIKFSLNDEEVSAVGSDFYSVVYQNVSLKKGDKLKLHAYWTNRVITNDTGFEIAVFSVNDGTGDYLIGGIK